MNESTAIGYVSPGEVATHFMQSVVDTIVADNKRASRARIVATISLISSPRIAAARNQIVEEFLDKTDAAWLLMVDTDMVFTPDAFDKIFEAAHPRDAPIVGGLCFAGGRSGVMFPTLYVLQDSEMGKKNPIRIIEDYPENARCEVDATGAAFLLMHRDALVKIGRENVGPYPWFIEGSVYNGVPFGEDWAFCMRAKMAGYPIYVHTGVKIGHIKPHVLDETTWETYRKQKAELGEDGVLAAHRKQVNG